MDNIDQSMQTLQRIDKNPDLVDVMISIEDYLDRSDLYAYKHWQDGELIAGPYIRPYWILVTFKWPYKSMPDPSGAERLLPHGTKIRYKVDMENVPQPIKTPSDYEPGTHKPKIKKEKVWLVEMMIPRRFVEDIDEEIMDLYDDKVDDTQQIKDAEATGNTEEQNIAGQDEQP